MPTVTTLLEPACAGPPSGIVGCAAFSRCLSSWASDAGCSFFVDIVPTYPGSLASAPQRARTTTTCAGSGSIRRASRPEHRSRSLRSGRQLDHRPHVVRRLDLPQPIGELAGARGAQHGLDQLVEFGLQPGVTERD